jgi:hypothetical protein
VAPDEKQAHFAGAPDFSKNEFLNAAALPLYEERAGS